MIRLCAFADEAGDSITEQISALKRNSISLIELRSINAKNVLDFSLDDLAALVYMNPCYLSRLFKKIFLQWFFILKN